MWAGERPPLAAEKVERGNQHDRGRLRRELVGVEADQSLQEDEIRAERAQRDNQESEPLSVQAALATAPSVTGCNQFVTRNKPSATSVYGAGMARTATRRA